jgi:hypothetical protein
MRTLSFSSLGVSAAAAAALIVGPFLIGGPPAIGPQERFEGVSTIRIDEQELEAFAEAYVVVAAVHQRIAVEGDRLAGDPGRLLALMEAGEAEATLAIETSGLTRDRFQEILAALASDDELRGEAISRISRARTASAAAREVPASSTIDPTLGPGA